MLRRTPPVAYLVDGERPDALLRRRQILRSLAAPVELFGHRGILGCVTSGSTRHGPRPVHCRDHERDDEITEVKVRSVLAPASFARRTATAPSPRPSTTSSIGEDRADWLVFPAPSPDDSRADSACFLDVPGPLLLVEWTPGADDHVR